MTLDIDSNKVKLILPPLEIATDEGFAKNDLFGKQPFGENLAEVIGVLNRGVVALDAGWGQGKTTFIKMWRGHVEHHVADANKMRTIYFDTFAGDYHQEPFLALTTEIYRLLTDMQNAKKTELEKAESAVIEGGMEKTQFKPIKTKLNAAIRQLEECKKELGEKFAAVDVTKVSTNVLLHSVSLMISKATNGFVEVNKALQSLTENKLDECQKETQSMEKFRACLESLVAEHAANQRPLVFIIDELDRCRPDFALELLEKIKHLFSVEGIVFLLVTNRSQLANVVRGKYGVERGDEYLQKFVNVWFNFPTQDHLRQDPNSEKYLKYICDVQLAATATHEYVMELEKFVSQLRLSLREIEQIMTFVVLIHNMRQKTLDKVYFYAYFFVTCLKVCRFDLFTKLAHDLIAADELFEELGLVEIQGQLQERVGPYSLSVMLSQPSATKNMMALIELELAESKIKQADIKMKYKSDSSVWVLGQHPRDLGDARRYVIDDVLALLTNIDM